MAFLFCQPPQLLLCVSSFLFSKQKLVITPECRRRENGSIGKVSLEGSLSSERLCAAPRFPRRVIWPVLGTTMVELRGRFKNNEKKENKADKEIVRSQ